MTRIWPLPCEGLGNNSYLAEVGSGLALAVDPGRDPRPYLGLAAAHGLRVAFTADTHVHADFVSGGRERAADGGRLLAPAGAGRPTARHGPCSACPAVCRPTRLTGQGGFAGRVRPVSTSPRSGGNRTATRCSPVMARTRSLARSWPGLGPIPPTSPGCPR